ncbi:MAG: hypothetical protein ACI9QN_001987 [Arcticibacterium sp.]|jgi:hypothetical protein
MPIYKPWIAFSIDNVALEKNALGVYEIADQNKFVIYIGEGVMKNRLSIHLRRMADGKFYRTLQMPSKLRCQQKERALQRAFRKVHKDLPFHNLQLGGLE